MKKLIILILLFVLAYATPCEAAAAFTDSIAVSRTWLNGFAWTGHVPKDRAFRWAKEVENKLDGDTALNNILFEQLTSDPTSTEGRFYYNSTSKVLKYHNGTSFQTIAAESGTVSLDVAYNNGNAIDVDGTAVTLTVSNTDNNVALAIVQNEATNDNDGVTIAQTGAGDALQISPQDTDSAGINIIAKASGTVSNFVANATAGWSGATGVGLVHINSDSALAHNKATLLFVGNATGQPKDGAEGYLARFVDSGTARIGAHAVEIETTNTTPALKLNNQLTITGADSAGILMAITGNDASGNSDTVTINHDGTSAGLKITCDGTTSVGLELASAATQTTTLALIDGTTGNWVGANDVGMVQLIKDTALANAGSSMLLITNSAQPVASAEGFGIRIVDTGTATTTAYAMGISTTNTTPCLFLNNELVISGADGSGTLLTVTSVNASGDADGIVITHSGSGDAIQLSPTDTDSVGINLIAKAASTVSILKVDAATNNVLLADNTGLIHVTNDTALTDNGATLLYVANATGQPKDGAEGFLARFVDTGTARTGAHAVEIETTNTTPALKLNNQLTITGTDSTGVLVAITGDDDTGDTDVMTIANGAASDAIQITNSDVGGTGLNVIATASQVTSSIIIDGATSNWDGADNVGMLHLTADDAAIHTGASMLVCRNTGTVIAAAEGFLARFIQDTGAAVTDAYAVEIETTNTTPALKLNNQLTISAADSAGVLFDITGTDTTTDSDSVVISHAGDGDAIQVTTATATGSALNAIAAAAHTTSLVKIDGATGDWRGASNVGMLHLTSDGNLASVNASLLYIANSGVPTNDSRGSSLRIIDTGNAAAGTAGYAVYIQATDATVEALYIDDGEVLIDEILTTGIGYQATVVTKVANTDGGSGSTVAKGTRVVHVTGFTGDANDWILIPDGTIGEKITIISDVAHEIRTPAASNDTINDVDSDGTQEYAVTLDDINDLVCTGTSASWIAVSHDKLGAAQTVAPD